VVVAVLALAACGGGGGGSSNAQEQIKNAYEQFFSGKTSISNRVALLQNGQRYRQLVASFASNPLAKNASATVSSVTLQGPNKAHVVYVVKLGGTALPKQTGTAVREHGAWRIQATSLCRLVALSGTTPAVCKS
jgi:hypothetical protein